MPDENFGLKDPDFWSEPLRDADEVPEDGLYLAAPSAVPLAMRSTLPLVLRRACSFKEVATVPFDRLALVHAVDVDRNRLYAGFAVDTDNQVEEPLSAEDLDAIGDGSMLQPYLIEARERLQLPWTPAELMVGVIVRGASSNRRKVVLGADASAYRDPAVDEFLESKRGLVPPPAPWPEPGQGGELPAYGRIDGSPAVPEKPGMMFSGDRVTVLEKGARCAVRAACRLPIRKQDLVDDGKRPERAVVTVNLLLTGADDPTPSIVTLRVPLYKPVTPGKDAEVYFAVDLLELFRIPRRTSTYFLYAFAREVMAGPSPFAFVTRDRLPPGAR